MTTRRADLRRLARRIFLETLRAADAGLAVRRAITRDGARLKILDAEFDARTLDVYAVALGKAAGPMAAALDAALGGLLREGVVSAPPLSAPLPSRWRVFTGGHPLPNEASLEAARAALSLLRRANDQAAGRERNDQAASDERNGQATDGEHATADCERVADGDEGAADGVSVTSDDHSHVLSDDQSHVMGDDQSHETDDGRGNERGARRVLVVFLVSGGGSALLETPRDPSITLEDLRVLNDALVTCGASISEINAVRRTVSAIKGGGLSRAAPRAAQITLVVSDVAAGEERTVASGPTFPADERADAAAAREVVSRYGLAARLPAAVLRAIEARRERLATGRITVEGAVEEGVIDKEVIDEEVVKGGAVEKGMVEERVSGERARGLGEVSALRRHFVLLDNAQAVERAAEVARAEGFAVEVARDIADQDVAEGARLLVSRLLELKKKAGPGRGACVVSGGEFACPVRGEGRGGRNSETALRCAIELDALAPRAAADGPTDDKDERDKKEVSDKDDGRSFERDGRLDRGGVADDAPRFVALCAGTDGIDGNSPAAGATCDETTITRARSLGLDPRVFLERSDSHAFFDALGDAFTNGPTGTNVRDLRILLAK